MDNEQTRFNSPPSKGWSIGAFALVGSLTSLVVYSATSFFISTSPNNDCCQGIQNLELMGEEVKLINLTTSKECCEACRAHCSESQRYCSCTAWSFCGNKQLCASRYGECRLRKQKDELAPVKRRSRRWTSGINFGTEQGVIGLETDYGTAHIKLLPQLSPVSVSVILDLLRFGSCAGCRLYRAERRGVFWDSEGRHVEGSGFGPPYALVQGSLDAYGMSLDIEAEYQPKIKRGFVGWVGSGPEFFVSLANHCEWKGKHTVFASVLPEDMWIFEKISTLPTYLDVWSNISVSLLRRPLSISITNRSITAAYQI